MAFRILIVDDSGAMRSVIRRVIDLSGFPVEQYFEAGDGSDALDLLRRENVDVVFTDINMPKMNGEQLLCSMQQEESLRSKPVIVVSTDATGNRMQRMLALGAKGYIAKPFFPETLRQELERVLGVVNA
jgi:two-component system chemotaxis response regulator CheY